MKCLNEILFEILRKIKHQFEKSPCSNNMNSKIKAKTKIKLLVELVVPCPQRNQQGANRLLILRRDETVLKMKPTMAVHLYQFIKKKKSHLCPNRKGTIINSRNSQHTRHLSWCSLLHNSAKLVLSKFCVHWGAKAVVPASAKAGL